MFYICSFPPILLFLNCLFIFLFKKWLGSKGIFYASIIFFITCIIIFFNEYLYIYYYGSYYFIDLGRWYFCLDILDSHLVFCFDSLSIISSILVLVLACLALYFGSEYMFREAFLNRLLYLLNMFSVSVIFLFISYDFFLIIISWECIGLFSFLLVNFYLTRVYTVKAALKTFVFSRISDLFMFFAFILIIFFF